MARKKRTVLQYGLNSDGKPELIKVWEGGAQEVQESLGVANVSQACKRNGTAQGFFWCYQDQEITEAEIIKGLNKINKRKGKPINQYDHDGKFIATWPTILKAAGELELSPVSIRSSIELKSEHGGYQWRYAEDIDTSDIGPYVPLRKAKKILQYDMDGVFLKQWNSITEIYHELGFKQPLIIQACNRESHSQGFHWRYFIEGQESGKKLF